MNTSRPKIAPYADWRSPLDPKQLFEKPSSPSLPIYHNGYLYWLQARASEGGRIVLIRCDAAGQEICLTPAEFNVRTRVHEYGGACHCFIDDNVLFSNYQDQRIYRQRLTNDTTITTPIPITSASGDREAAATAMYADFSAVPNKPWLLCVQEQSIGEEENRNAIVAVSLHDDLGHEPIALVTQSDFVACPAVSPKGDRVAWIQWQHPNMPWDSSIVCIAELGEQQGKLQFNHICQLAGGENKSVCQLTFGGDGTLYFAMDEDIGDDAGHYWNIYRHNANTDHDECHRVTSDTLEYGEAHWIFGQRRILVDDDNTLWAIRTGHDGDELVSINNQGELCIVNTTYNQFSQLSPYPVHRGKNRETNDISTTAGVVAVAASSQSDGSIMSICGGDKKQVKEIKTATPVLEDVDISVARPIQFPTRDGEHSYAYFYTPRNSAYKVPDGVRPPLVVFVHGGPTSRTNASFSVAKQYWTTSGFSLLDVNHRGSTGYGRQFRQALNGQWGEIDVQDVVDAVRYAIAQQWVDERHVFIRGGSAGGYSVLRALTEFRNIFCAGACYYGIGNLQTLAQITHKFESRYLDGLLGETYDARKAQEPTSRYYQRSPIFALDKLVSPLILFQGDEDKVVPPALSRDMARSLQERDITHEYIEYKGEGHGFRRSETRIDALNREVAFFRAAMSSSTAS